MTNVSGKISVLIGILGDYLLDKKVHSVRKKDKDNIRRLRIQIKKMPKIKSEKSHALSQWNNNRVDLRNHILNDDLSVFLNWNVITGTMFADANIKEFFSLLLNRWQDWQKVLTETTIGSGKRYLLYPKTSPNLIHNAFHLQQIVPSPTLLKDFGEVIEFGGGYGCMCSLFLKASFGGKYKIFDLPEFSALQQFYLHSVFTESKVRLVEYHHDKF